MGCDIHFYVERREGDRWVSCDERGRGKYDSEGETSVLRPFYDGRNYDLFSILANVRNGYGFAGVPTGEGFVPIAEPRGVPDDASPEYLAEVERWGVDGHSHQHLTLQEILDYDWTQVTRKTGVVSLVEWAYFNSYRDEGPRSWSGGVSGPGIRVLDDAEFIAAWKRLCIEDPDLKPGYSAASWLQRDEAKQREMVRLLGGGRPYAQVTWATPYYRAAGHFWSETIPRLLRLGKPEDVRCVFFFDN